MRIAIGITLVAIGVVVGWYAARHFKGDSIHDMRMECQHLEITREILQTRVDVLENGRKLDILLNIATNSLNGDFRRN